jgi:hypothetical protein
MECKPKCHYYTNLLGLAKYYYHKITGLEIGRACGTHGRNIYKDLVRKPEGNGSLSRPRCM